MIKRALPTGMLYALLFAGCGTVYHVGDAVIDKPGTSPPVHEDRLMEINLDNFHFIEDRNTNNPTAYSKAVADSTGATRNRLQSAIMTAGDKHCAVHKSRALATFNNTNLITGIAGAGLAGAAAVAKGEIAKRLAAGAGFSQATRSEINLNVYRQSLIEAVFKAIDNERQRQEQLFRPRRTEILATYSVDEAIRDAFRYADACSIYQGVQLLQDAVSKNNPCRILRERKQVLEAELEKTAANLKTGKEADIERIRLQLTACSGVE